MENLNLEWSSLIVEELVRNNITHFCISPGSRSTPLTIAAAKHPRTKTVLILDERSAGYYAVGYAKAVRRPTVLICTSGTAVANYFPAIIEAFHSNLPLIIITADRPSELRKCGANQTIDQTKIFSDYLRWEIDLPSPNTAISKETLLHWINQAVSHAVGISPGPVHINCMFRKPLIPMEADEFKINLSVSEQWNKSDAPLKMYEQSNITPSENTINKLSQLLSKEKGLLIIGELNSEEECRSVEKFAEKLNWPTVTDILSGLRLTKKYDNFVDHYEQIICSERSNCQTKYETVFHIGGTILSEKLQIYIKSIKPVKYIKASSNSSENDPNHLVTLKIHSDLNILCSKLIHRISDKNRSNSIQVTMLEKQQKKIEEKLDIFSETDSLISEISVARLTTTHIKENSALFIGNSMPIRDFNSYSKRSDNTDRKHLVKIGANRGVSGIDGIIASACGFFSGFKKKGTLVLGDLSLLHDMNSLSIIDSTKIKIIIIAINNNGGGIFSFLPISKHKDIFDKYFGTPHNYSFKQLSEMFGLEYFNPVKNKDFIEIYNECQQKQESCLIEIKTSREKNIQEHKILNDEITKIIN
ncbi:MAG TPA: 2-succinyl-5-enolpyruvyl-6-hydroxy-3-cyclohexene-1-carboxylic-acid synthase [Victivallales bacterium]|nr:2-succinyl-5-enolpyruvyl-6-hydroxy-3-cyclohexene-1-carboxylic-acid synthase [Victivallales bacterium]